MLSSMAAPADPSAHKLARTPRGFSIYVFGNGSKSSQAKADQERGRPVADATATEPARPRKLTKSSSAARDAALNKISQPFDVRPLTAPIEVAGAGGYLAQPPVMQYPPAGRSSSDLSSQGHASVARQPTLTRQASGRGSSSSASGSPPTRTAVPTPLTRQPSTIRGTSPPSQGVRVPSGSRPSQPRDVSPPTNDHRRRVSPSERSSQPMPAYYANPDMPPSSTVPHGMASYSMQQSTTVSSRDNSYPSSRYPVPSSSQSQSQQSQRYDSMSASTRETSPPRPRYDSLTRPRRESPPRQHASGSQPKHYEDHYEPEGTFYPDDYEDFDEEDYRSYDPAPYAASSSGAYRRPPLQHHSFSDPAYHSAYQASVPQRTSSRRDSPDSWEPVENPERLAAANGGDSMRPDGSGPHRLRRRPSFQRHAYSDSSLPPHMGLSQGASATRYSDEWESVNPVTASMQRMTFADNTVPPPPGTQPRRSSVDSTNSRPQEGREAWQGEWRGGSGDSMILTQLEEGAVPSYPPQAYEYEYDDRAQRLYERRPSYNYDESHYKAAPSRAEYGMPGSIPQSPGSAASSDSDSMPATPPPLAPLNTSFRVRWDENLIAPSPVEIQRPRGWFNRRGDQLWTNGGAYRPPAEGYAYPPHLDDYPDVGEGWMNESGVRIDTEHRLIPKMPIRSALKRRET